MGTASIAMMVGLSLAVGGLARWREGNTRGAGVLVAGVVVVLVSFGALRWVGRTWQRAVAADAREARAAGAIPVPSGARPRAGGVVLRPRAAVRLVPPLLVALMALAAWGMAEDGLRVQSDLVLAASGVVLVLWLYARSYEICLDASGIWRRRRPRWRLAWSDLRSVEDKPTSNRWYPDRPDDLLLHGHITTPGGRVRDVVRIRCNLLAILPDDLRALADRCSTAAAATQSRTSGPSGADSPFQRWG
ncbi:hypothetical protein GCM10027517_28720 [Phycicoccus ginsengisoli]